MRPPHTWVTICNPTLCHFWSPYCVVARPFVCLAKLTDGLVLALSQATAGPGASQSGLALQVRGGLRRLNRDSADIEVLETPQYKGVLVHKIVVGSHRDVGKTIQQQTRGNTGFKPGQTSTRTKMLAVTKSQVIFDI